jgi:hypothetical protein
MKSAWEFFLSFGDYLWIASVFHIAEDGLTHRTAVIDNKK